MTRAVSRVVVAGFYPPPITGQAVATQRLATLLEEAKVVTRLDLALRSPSEAAQLSSFDFRMVWRALQHRRAWRQSASEASAVLWTSLSPSRWGALRDFVLMPSPGRPSQQLWGVVHHGDFEAALQHPLRKRILHRTLNRLSGIVLLSEALRERVRPHLGDIPAFVIPNTLDENSIATPEELIHRRSRKALSPHLLFFSNMIKTKGYADVLQAVHLLQQRGVPARATFAGAWPDSAAEADFRSAADKLHLSSSVEILGSVSDSEHKRRLFLDADVFVLPSYYPTEAQPLTILEALATGTPVITTRQGGIPEMLDEDVEGHFVATRDPGAIANAVCKLSNCDNWNRKSEAAWARFNRQFHPDIVRQQWLTLLDGSHLNS